MRVTYDEVVALYRKHGRQASAYEIKGPQLCLLGILYLDKTGKDAVSTSEAAAALGVSIDTSYAFDSAARSCNVAYEEDVKWAYELGLRLKRDRLLHANGVLIG